MQVTADGALVDRSFGVVFAIVAGADDSAAERLDAGAQIGPSGVVLEADQSPRLAVEVRLDEHVADVALRPGHAAHVEQACARQLLAVDSGIALAEELVAAAHGQ